MSFFMHISYILFAVQQHIWWMFSLQMQRNKIVICMQCSAKVPIIWISLQSKRAEFFYGICYILSHVMFSYAHALYDAQRNKFLYTMQCNGCMLFFTAQYGLCNAMTWVQNLLLTLLCYLNNNFTSYLLLLTC